MAGIVLLAGAVVITRQAQTNSTQARRLAQLDAENQRLRTRIETSARQTTEAPLPSAPARTREPAKTEPKSPLPREMAAGSGEDAQTIERLRDTLAEVNASVARLESRIQDLEGQLQKLTTDNKRLAASEADLNENLAGANRLIETLQKELKTKGARLAQLEIADQKLREQGRADEKKLSQISQLSTELQEIHRRRETYLNSILRRYKDVTDQYRALYGMLENRRIESPAVSGADLSRIQSSIAMAEEDLRQLTSLNAQALRIQKKIAER